MKYTETITDRNNTGHKLQQVIYEKELAITTDRTNDKSFERFRASLKYSAVWLDLEMQQFKNNRTTFISIEIDKKQAELMLEKLKEFVSKMEY